MIFTQDILEKGKSSNGAWSARQLRLLGLDFNALETGWAKRLIGTDIPQSVIEAFLSLKDAHLKGQPLPKKKKSKKKSSSKTLKRLSRERNRKGYEVSHPRFSLETLQGGHKTTREAPEDCPFA